MSRSARFKWSARILVNSLRSVLERAMGCQLARFSLFLFLNKVTTIASEEPRRRERSVMHLLKKVVRIGLSGKKKYQ